MTLPLYHTAGSPITTSKSVHGSSSPLRDLTDSQRRGLRFAITFFTISAVLYLGLLSAVFVFGYENISILAVTHSCARLATWYLVAIAAVLLAFGVWCIIGLLRHTISQSWAADKEVLRFLGMRIMIYFLSGIGLLALASWNHKLVGVVEEIVEALTS